MMYRNIGGDHVQDGRTFKRGEFVETSLDLPRLFPGKFEKVPTSAIPVANETAAPETPAANETAAPETSKPVSGDVTSQFAKDIGKADGIKVFRIETGFMITDDGDAVNDKPIKTPKGVSAAIVAYLK